MKYLDMSYLDKIKALQGVYVMSTRLAEVLRVSRVSLVNWMNKPESISADNRFHIDVLYCKHFLVPEWDDATASFEAVLLPDDKHHYRHVMMPFLRRLSYGTVEIETSMRQVDFDAAVDAKKIPRHMTVQTFHEAWNTFSTIQWLWSKVIEHGETFEISEESTLFLHDRLMRGVHADAGFYSKHRRVMGHLEHFDTTWPEDIPEEMNRWVYRYKCVSELHELAQAHVHFMSIHPFGDGNGRVGRALLLAQCLNARLMPPILHAGNRAAYYAVMEHAMVHQRYAPLTNLLYEASLEAREMLI